MGRELVPEEIRAGTAYETVRGDERSRIAALQRYRRVSLGRVLSLVFQNRETLTAALEEMLRTQRSAEPDRVAAGVAAFNAMLPDDPVLGATLYVDVADPAELAQAIADLGGIERSVYLDIGGERVGGLPDVGEAEDEAAGAWHISFPLGDPHRDAWSTGAEIAVGVEHPAYSARVVLGEEQRRAIGADL